MSKQKTQPGENGTEANGRVTYTNDVLNASFSLPDKITVRQQIYFRSHISTARSELDVFLPYWEAGHKFGLIGDWQAAVLPDPHKLDLDEETNPDIAAVVIWTANTVASHMLNLGGETVPKN